MKNKLTILLLFLLPSLALSQNEMEDYYKIAISTGESPECINCSQTFDRKIDNFLRINAHGASDVVVKIMNTSNDKCIRKVFINGGDVYEVTNIPEGIYYLKIAYGYDWSKKVVGSFCFAKFTRDSYYQVGTDLLDYNIKKYSDGYQVPSYEVVLTVISNNRNNEFEVENISEEEFYR